MIKIAIDKIVGESEQRELMKEKNKTNFITNLLKI